ncbi:MULTISPECIES: alanyl-tRNA editing protein [unclassified Roseovarius]|uniref:alanyl-tRNA editing protein n=1 Tax=unclassified Roseovarius TaxID=2614913 RepID=UPI00273FA6AB|nr:MULTISPECIES: alanyl-tRNA editing protein [unclassified Roseovarius]
MTARLFLDDPYLTRAKATVMAHTPEGGIVVDRSVFYPTGGGQPGDSGHITWAAGRAEIMTTVKGEGESIALIPGDGAALPPVGQEIEQVLDWERRHRHMRVHTGLHLLSVVIPLPVTGGSIGTEKGRLDFNMPEAPEDKPGIEAALNALVARDLAVTEGWISDDDLRANPGLVKTMSVAPPMGAGRVRLIRIGTDADQVDLQPCGGTHVRSSAEIGALRIGKIEKKGRQNRRVYMHLAD